MSAVIGKTLPDDTLLRIDDYERRSGLYILGKPRMGKSWLLINLIHQDIQNGHGIFFIDPHGDAINDLLTRFYIRTPVEQYILLDPEDQHTSFGINLLECKDVANLKARNDVFTRAKGVFDKLWKNAFEEKPWLQLILQNTIYAFIENQGYTIAEFPLFYNDPAFRAYIVGSIKYNRVVAEFWTKTFPSQSKYMQQEEIRAARTRAETLLAHPYVSHIVGQAKTTLDFEKILEEKKIVLVRLSTSLSDEAKKIIGTILISELVHAIERRGENRDQFCVFVDEFQNFASFQDFPTLITRAPKLGIATTLAHHERYGQLTASPDSIGATAAIVNKVLFQLTEKDAQELAPGFAKKPPTEKKREQELSLSPNPVSDLLYKSHTNLKISAFVHKYFHHMQNRQEDIRADMEFARLEKMTYTDQAGILGVDERVASLFLDNHYTRYKLLQQRGAALERAQDQTGALINLFEMSNNLRLTQRGLNEFLLGIMEGKIACGQEEFSKFLINLVHDFDGVAAEHAPALKLYILLSYGDLAGHLSIPFEFARAHGFFAQEAALLTYQAEQKTRDERLEFQERYIREEEEERARWRRQQKQWKRQDKRASLQDKLDATKRRRTDIRDGWTSSSVGGVNRLGSVFHAPENYLWNPPNVYMRFEWFQRDPYVRQLLAPYQKARFNESWQCLLRAPSVKEAIVKLEELLVIKKFWGHGYEKYMDDFNPRTLRRLKKFLYQYQEAAFVMLALLDCAVHECWENTTLSGDDISMAEFPGIEGKDPIEVWCLIETLRDSYWGERHSYPIFERIRRRKDVQFLEIALRHRVGWFAANHKTAADRWEKLNECVRSYLLCRAGDLLSFGDEYACLPPSTPPYEEVVVALMSLSRDTRARLDEMEEEKEAAKERERIEKQCAEKVAEISYSPPAVLEPRVLSEDERQKLREACITQLQQADQKTRTVAAIIDEFAEFCTLLAKPENHILVPSGQWTFREVPSRTEADMAGEVVRELVDLPRYTAYAKILQKKEIWKGKIQALELPPPITLEGTKYEGVPKLWYETIEWRTWQYHSLRRDEIEKEIKERQEKWKQKVSDVPLQSKIGEELLLSSLPAVKESDEPPSYP